MQWVVEVKPDVFDRVYADSVTVESGCLVFRDKEDSSDLPSLIMAPGTFLTVTQGEGGDPS